VGPAELYRGGDFYIFNIRPRVRVPESWNWPVGVSLSAEIGYQRPAYSADTWTGTRQVPPTWEGSKSSPGQPKDDDPPGFYRTSSILPS
jgi:hypothetical protein